MDQVVLTRGQKIAASRATNKAARLARSRPSAAHICVVVEHQEPIAIRVDLEDGANLVGTIPNVNKVLEKLGYKPVRITYNMLNKEAGPLVIDKDTPSYCDVGSESYWSM